jgi:hypothetical protein
MAHCLDDLSHRAEHLAFEALLKASLIHVDGICFLGCLTDEAAARVLLIGCEAGYCRAVVRPLLEDLVTQDSAKAIILTEMLREHFAKGWRCTAHCFQRPNCFVR